MSTTIDTKTVKANPRPAAEEAPAKSKGYWHGVGARLIRDPVSMICAGLLALLLGAVVFAPLLPLADPFTGSMVSRLKPIGTEGHILGTDELGRDMFARLIYGGRLTLMLGLLPVAFAFAIGTCLGVLAGYVGGWLNTAIMRTVDVFFAFPSILLAIAISGALGAGIVNSLVSLTIVFIPPITRVAESVTASVRSLEYVDAARISGAHPLTVVRVHVLGNVMSPIFVYATSLTSVSMILAAGLSFLGLGVKPPEPEWGLMLNTLRTAIYIDPVLAALPGAMIFLTSLCLNLLSDGLRSAMNIKD
ncbi:peptide/nickel transport system permease protein [Fulvimarina manganoxydans]|uniref:Peptide/nickel transport system permease protein n=1 Tax=Fulvimarina manganoxydans TaxID=937218 RepID=A0A1W1YXW7_9HYPH|nr:ABC transporter permease [Fulvimarina manganoxydans]MCK5933605.1 ABC transporter permease [Fulvimarina manganoxydans]SMC40671.1 peptide/nickel transport system permease protein [Fulvimarina manganoxydans]